MAQDENSGSDDENVDQKATEGDGEKKKHKVIADVHSGMVLVAPVATPLEEDDEPEAADDEESPGPLN